MYLSDSDDKQTFKNTDKAIFNTYYTNTFLLTRQSSLISIIGYTVCLDKNDFLLAEYNSRSKANVFTSFFAAAQKKKINFRFSKHVRHADLSFSRCNALQYMEKLVCVRTVCIGYVAAITQSKKDSQ